MIKLIRNRCGSQLIDLVTSFGAFLGLSKQEVACFVPFPDVPKDLPTIRYYSAERPRSGINPIRPQPELFRRS